MPLPDSSLHTQRKGLRKRSLVLTGAFILSLVLPPLLSLVGFFLSLWIVIPAFTSVVLPLGVGAPEVSLWLLVVNAIALRLSFLGLQKGWLYSVAFSLSLVGLILSALPLIQLPAANASFANEMKSGFGANYLQQIPAAATGRLRAQPFSLLDAFRGIPVEEIRVNRGLPFATPNGITLKLNLYRPLQAGKHPTIVVIYGGAWKGGTPDNDESFSHYMAAQGYTVVAIDYRHALTFNNMLTNWKWICNGWRLWVDRRVPIWLCWRLTNPVVFPSGRWSTTTVP
jgi:hypothetical protein